jgi:hypothetical protein
VIEAARKSEAKTELLTSLFRVSRFAALDNRCLSGIELFCPLVE